MKKLSALALIALAAAALAAGASSMPAARTQAVKVSYATSFGTFGRDAYAYVALDRGYFESEGLDVSIVPGTGSVDNMKLIAAGRLDFAPIDITAAVLTRANENVPVKIVAAVHQNTLSSILALKESGIASPKDLEGKKIADAPGSTVRAVFPLYAKRSGIDAGKVTFVPATPPALPSLLASKQVDAVGQFTVGIPLFQRAAGGKPIVSFPYAKVLPGLMGIGLAVADETIAENPDLVRRFTRALLRGLRYSIDNPGDAGRILKKYVPLADHVVAAQELRIMRKYVQTPATREKGIGFVDPKRMAATISIVTNFFKPKQHLAVGDVYAAGFVPAPRKKR